MVKRMNTNKDNINSDDLEIKPNHQESFKELEERDKNQNE